jgi:hypothetical protein
MSTYICAMCGKEDELTTPEVEKVAELHEYFGQVDTNDCDTVCDDCWEKVKPNG